MAHVISFHSTRFDVASEPPNPINPIFGESVLRWLREKLDALGYETNEPAPEDWGWYVDVKGAGASYFVGASGEAAEDGSGRSGLGHPDRQAPVIEGEDHGSEHACRR